MTEAEKKALELYPTSLNLDRIMEISACRKSFLKGVEHAKQSDREGVKCRNCDEPHGEGCCCEPQPKPQEKVDLIALAKAELIDTIGRHNLTVSQAYKFQFSEKESELFAEMMVRFTNTLQDTKLREAAEEWNKYKSFLQEKYPVEEGEEWSFTCEHHQKIDEILNSKKH